MFCILCANILYEKVQPLSFDFSGEADYKHHASLRDLEHAAAKGCIICSTLSNQLTDDQRNEIHRRHPDTITLSATLSKGRTPNTINFEISFDPDIFIETGIDMMLSSSIMAFQPVTGMLTNKLTVCGIASMRLDADSLA